MANQLLNITHTSFYLIHNRNLELLIDLLSQLLQQPTASNLHLIDSAFTQKVLRVFDQLLDHEMDEMQMNVLLMKLYEYGVKLLEQHAKMPYLRDFEFQGNLIGEFSKMFLL